jgi:hypothetical protein
VVGVGKEHLALGLQQSSHGPVHQAQPRHQARENPSFYPRQQGHIPAYQFSGAVHISLGDRDSGQGGRSKRQESLLRRCCKIWSFSETSMCLRYSREKRLPRHHAPATRAGKNFRPNRPRRRPFSNANFNPFASRERLTTNRHVVSEPSLALLS